MVLLGRRRSYDDQRPEGENKVEMRRKVSKINER